MIVSSDMLLAFLAASALITIAPGPDNLMVLGFGVSRGRYAGIGAAIGCALGCLTHTLWAALGVSALIAASSGAFLVLKLAGGGYLLWLGFKAWRLAGHAVFDEASTTAGHHAARYLWRGFLANAVNPKVALFFLAFLPQFVESDSSGVTAQLLFFGGVFAAQTALIFTLIACFSAVIGTWLKRRPSLSQWLDRATGALFVGLGLKLVLSSKP